MATYDGNLVDPGGAGKRFFDGSWINRIWGGNVTPPTPTPGGLTYRMRGYDTGLGQTVFWSAPIVDASATYYGGPGPVTNIVVQDVIGA